MQLGKSSVATSMQLVKNSGGENPVVTHMQLEKL
jgi:hypothetical protein